MNEDMLRELLKIDLQITTGKMDDYLHFLISTAKELITKEGIILESNQEDGALVIMYAAYLYRKRREDVPIPRMLRYALNNRLFSQKGR